MPEKYSFENRNEAFNSLTLTSSEIRTLKNLGLQPEELDKLLQTEPFDEGSYALIFNLPEQQPQQVAKVWKNPDNASDRATHENTALRLLRRRGYDYAPEISGFLKSATILFEEKIHGKAIEKFDSKTIEQLATTMSSLHSIELNSFGKPGSSRKEGTQLDYLRACLTDLRNKVVLFTEKSGESKKMISAAIQKIEESALANEEAFNKTDFTLIHFDLNAKNILQTDDGRKIILIDWEQASAGDNAMDIAKMFLKLNFTNNEEEVFLAEYEKGLPHKDIYLHDRLPLYEQFVLVNSVLWRLSVLEDEREKKMSVKSEQFYDRVRANLDPEMILLKRYINNQN